MSGHSKWSTIKRKKEKTDAQRAKIFTKMGREISVAVRDGGADPSSNSKLRELIAKAKSLNVPNENINRVIKRAEGGERDDYENITYEGYGPGGVAVLVETLTDNRNRTAANMRHYFDKYGASLGQSGSVAFLFSQKGVIIIEGDALNEDALMEHTVEADAEDFTMQDGFCEVLCAPNDVQKVSAYLADKGYAIASAEAEYLPGTTSTLSSDDELKRMRLLLDYLDEDEDVQNVWHNMENEQDLNR